MQFLSLRICLTVERKKQIIISDKYQIILKTALADVYEGFGKEVLFESGRRLPLMDTRKRGSPKWQEHETLSEQQLVIHDRGNGCEIKKVIDDSIRHIGARL